MLTECIEMESRSPQPTRNRLVKKILAEELELRDLPQGKAISCWWLTLPVFYYLTVIAGGIMASTGVGKVATAFDENCILYANLNLKGLDDLNHTKVLTNSNVEVVKWGTDTCLFCEYASVACIMYAGVLLVMVLQCGRGGGKSAFKGRGIAESWRIVPVAFVFNLIFLILSSIIFSYVHNGFSAFCDGMGQVASFNTLGNVTRCADVLQFTFPWDKGNTNLHTNYVVAKIGSSLQLGGSLLAFLTIIIRCIIPADFIVYRRRKIMISHGIQTSTDEERSETSSHGGGGGDRVVSSTTVECHHRPASNGGEESCYLNLTGGDTDSLNSARSDVQLFSESRSSPKKKGSKS